MYWQDDGGCTIFFFRNVKIILANKSKNNVTDAM